MSAKTTWVIWEMEELLWVDVLLSCQIHRIFCKFVSKNSCCFGQWKPCRCITVAWYWVRDSHNTRRLMFAHTHTHTRFQFHNSAQLLTTIVSEVSVMSATFTNQFGRSGHQQRRSHFWFSPDSPKPVSPKPDSPKLGLYIGVFQIRRNPIRRNPFRRN